MNLATRLNRLLPGLSAKERAIQEVRAWQEGRTSDPALRRTTPRAQEENVRWLLRRVQDLHSESAAQVDLCTGRTAHLRSLLGWLGTIHLWGLDVERFSSHIAYEVPEPIVEGEFERRREAAAATSRNVDEWAELLVNDEDDGSWSDQEWERRARAKATELRDLVADGRLQGETRRRKLVIRADAFYAWWGRPLLVVPEQGSRFEVRPDDQREAVRLARARRATLAGWMERMPAWLGSPTEAARVLVEPEGTPRTFVEELAIAALRQLTEGIADVWQTLTEVEAAAAEVEEELGIDDLLHPSVRRQVAGLRAELLDTRLGLLRYLSEIPLPGSGLTD